MLGQPQKHQGHTTYQPAGQGTQQTIMKSLTLAKGVIHKLTAQNKLSLPDKQLTMSKGIQLLMPEYSADFLELSQFDSVVAGHLNS